MDDIRQLLRDNEADIPLRTLTLLLRGLNAALYDLISQGAPEGARERLRYHESVESIAFCAQLLAVIAARASEPLDDKIDEALEDAAVDEA